MHIAILTFQGFNELDSLIALGVLNRIHKPNWRVTLCSPERQVTSMNGVTVHSQSTLDAIPTADPVIVCSGIDTRESINDSAITTTLRLATSLQLTAAQCSGARVPGSLEQRAHIPA